VRLQQQFEVAQSASSVWEFFEQPEAVAECVPGVEQLTVVTPDDVEVRVTQSVGPMTATFAATVKIVERVPEKLISFTATGKSVRGAMGNVRATVTVQLEAVGDRTLVLVEGDVVLAGALGSVGQKVVAKQVGKVTAQFAGNLEAAFGGGRPATTTQPHEVGSSTAAVPTANSRVSRQLPPVSDPAPRPDPWAKVAAGLSAVSVLLSVLALRRRAPRRRRR
jgi:uncharacterized protein